MSTRDIRLVCFDLGGVVVRICRSWQEGCAAAGIEANSRIDPGRHPACHELIELHQTGRIDLPTYAQRLSEAIGGELEPMAIARIHDAWICGAYDGIPELVDAIHDAELETAALSNTSAEHWVQLLQYPAVQRMRHRHASHLLGLAKPDPAIYRAFEREVGYAAGQILFFDDLPQNISAAREAGWSAVQIDHTRPTAPQIARAMAERRIGVPVN